MVFKTARICDKKWV